MTDSSPTTFFSYSRADSEFALRLAQDLRAAGAKVWLDQLDIGPGRHWDTAIEQALRDCPNQLVILSPDSVSSNNVMDEVSFALEEGKQVIPVLYRECQIPFRLRRVQYIDVRADYQRGVSELLKALGVAEPAAAPPVAPAPPGAQAQMQPEPAPLPPLPSRLAPQAQPPTPPPAPRKPDATVPSPRQRLLGALAGAVVGAVVGIVSLMLAPTIRNDSEWIFVPAAAGVIAGAIAGNRRRVITAALGTAIVGWIALYIFDPVRREASLAAAVFGATPGAILGAIAGVIYVRRARTTKPESVSSSTPPSPGLDIDVPSQRQRLLGALAGAAVGAVVGLVGVSMIPFWMAMLGWVFVPAAAGAVAGAIAGSRRMVIKATLGMTLLGWLAVYVLWTSRREVSLASVVLGASPGAVLGAIAGAIYLKRANKRTH